ncbi:fungal specific transcription factor domain-containing protein 5 [Elsinoe australis]|uniref:Fungal specific transcription factor domain-containing protein 5 n=1 Tax=Elsinoe australis TaxID=40998 RepID=A0A4U7BAA6_9PEZI|nr:fungal specific transcription factor domain-containing protein 5 [Elsinoe australis]
MVLRTCQLCDRKFTKTEHFKRHQRSHTKERPYECPTCQKRFSRSDVLYRHTKLHQQQDPNDPAVSPNNVQHAPNGHQHHPQQQHDHNGMNEPPHPGSVPQRPPSDLDSQHSLQNANYSSHIHPQLRQMSIPSVTNGFDPLRPSMSNPSPIQPSPIANPQPIPPMHHRQSVSSNHAYTPQMLPPQEQPQHSAVDSHMNGTTPMNPPPSLPHENSQRETVRNDTNLESPYQPGSFDGNASDMLQFWLSQADNDIDFSMLQMPEFGGPLHHTNSNSTSQPSPPPIARSHSDSIGSIPEARFARVEEVWRAKVAKSHYFQNLWMGLAESSATNIFCCDRAMAKLPYNNNHNDSRWGVNTAVRNQLKIEFGTPAPTPGGLRAPPNTNQSVKSNFPPAEVLDMSLDIYFRRIHPMAPFIHVPTFQASSTPPALLFIMTVLGLSTMSTSGGSKFVKKAFLDVRHRALQELVATASVGTTMEERLCAFATSLLTLQLAVFSADVDFIAQSQALYSTLIAVSMRQGLFNAGEASSSEFLPDTAHLRERWTAWARVESVRRLVSCLISADWWWGNNSCANPLIHPEAVQMSLPSDDDLFNARSAEEWWQLIQAGRNFEMPTIKPRGFHLKGSLDSVLIQPHPIQPFSMYSLLTVIKHMVSDTQHRYFAQIDDWNGLDRLVPWKTYRHDFRGCSFVPTIVQLAQAAITSRRHSDLNVAILWHNLNINLTSNIQIFELAAGRSGPARGATALSDIATWSKTPAARRAAIHSAHTYRYLSNRKVSDTMMLNCLSALFSAALILGLFVFQISQEEESSGGPQALPFDLMGDVDWTLVGDCGLTDPVTNPVAMYDAHQRTPATDFINWGGPILLNGIPAQGYVSARRVLLDFAHLMDEMGAWKPKTFSRILHIMSDVLEDSG